MTKVYAVSRGVYSDYGIDAIFSTKEKAQKYIDHQSKFCNVDFNDIEEYDIDETLQPWNYISVEMEKNGDVMSVQHLQEGHGYKEGVSCDGTWIRCIVKTDDEERAVKVANERRTKIIANNQWLQARMS